jgi:hypothetical protein
VAEDDSEAEAAGFEEAAAPLLVLEVLRWAVLCNDTGHSLRHLHRPYRRHYGLEAAQVVEAVHHEGRR